ncbi:Tc5 transposase DNA-binding domain [Popillia japonica]|uniref:Tc5 transposase DNA-binding domain n=1 Tax=Popillia japonica TaxID=7064 RepID=A0AAW1LLM5_POPJA
MHVQSIWDIFDIHFNLPSTDIALNGHILSVEKIEDIISTGTRIDEITLKWFSAAGNKNIPVSGTMISEKVTAAAESFDVQDFKAPSDWLEKFGKRHAIAYESICGEVADVNPVDAESLQYNYLQ